MRTLIAYYSRTGTTRQAAMDLAQELTRLSGVPMPAESDVVDMQEIVDLRRRTGVLGWLRAAYDAARKRRTTLGPLQHDPANYDAVVIGTPVWAFTMACAVRTWLEDYRSSLKNVSFFCTMGGSGQESTFREMEQLSGLKPKATLALLQKDVRRGTHHEAMADFARRIVAR